MKLTLGEKDFELKDLTLNDWINAEELGLELAKLQDPNNLKLKDIRTLIYIVIKKVDPEISEEWVGEQLGIQSDLQEVLNIVTNFIAPNNMPESQNT